jgi:hypothetical protein
MKIEISNFKEEDKETIETFLNKFENEFTDKLTKKLKGNLAMRFFSKFSPIKINDLSGFATWNFVDGKYIFQLVFPFEPVTKGLVLKELRKYILSLNPEIKVEEQEKDVE